MSEPTIIGGATLHLGDVLDGIPLPDESIQCCVTSPPYWGLRDYGVEGQIGLERTPEEYVEKIVRVFREVRRVLRSDGTLWLNLGDCYASCAGGYSETGSAGSTSTAVCASTKAAVLKGRNRKPPRGLKPKDLVGIPWRVAFALQADGWWLRSEIIWAKPNPMPESVTDRPTKAHEQLFLLTKSPDYFYDAEAVKESAAQSERIRRDKIGGGKGDATHHSPGSEFAGASSRNRRSVWTVTPQPFAEAHFATFPPALVEPCILAGTSEHGCCPACGAPWEREVEHFRTLDGERRDDLPPMRDTDKSAPCGAQGVSHMRTNSVTRTLGWRPTCECPAARPVPCAVLDPFNGAGTTGLVALQHGRRYVGVELNPEYLAMSERRLRAATAQGDLFRAAPSSPPVRAHAHSTGSDT